MAGRHGRGLCSWARSGPWRLSAPQAAIGPGLALALLAALLGADFTPRFFQGDSFSYLLTGTDGWIPPDRSWLFGFLAAFVVRNTHGYAALILLQAAALGGMIASLRWFFPGRPRTLAAVAACLALDPLLEVYARFVMSDLLAAAMFAAALCGMLRLVGEGASRRVVAGGLCVVLLATTAAIFLRVAYAVIIEGAIIIAGGLLFRRLSSHARAAIAAGAAAPILGVLLLAGANSVVFRDRFPNELFVTKLSGVFLAAVFAPALDIDDFARAGIPATPAEFAALDLHNYDKRLKQVWGGPPFTLQLYIGAKLGIHEEYTRAVDAASMRLVESALLRHPLGLLRVYAENFREYFSPSGWRAHAVSELGLDLKLPEKFVAVSASRFGATLDANLPQERSLLVRATLAWIMLYPFQLAAGLLGALYLLARRRPRPEAIVLAAGLLADVAAAPFYSNYVIPRYVLGGVFLSTALIGLAAQQAFAGRADRRV